MNTAKLKEKIIRNLEHIDSDMLEKINELINESFHESKVEVDTNEYINRQIDIARMETEQGKVISHEEALKRVKEWKQK